ncbi:damage-inducible protein DinB [Pseudomonas sp. FW300-N1A1]|uniref:DinB family protein n=1 Tax=Pseudomonas sp. FW300-N1A1 TaxID=2075555 RepID=UPI000CD205FD|nr:DinB family protein [Pseudomonas sp. FW300-N1A1]POA18368.1 damage-inducible protein DinB [Pseudomonas sp. FW300-N1A1]
MKQPLSHHLLTMAYQNAWANHRLGKACAQLSQSDFEARRVSFFPSIKATLNHILTCDWFYVDALEREMRGDLPHPQCDVFFQDEEPFASSAELMREQHQVDLRLIAYCAQLRDAGLTRRVTTAREIPQQDTRLRMLSHLFEHQIHHRGQVHAMLSGTPVAPPQLDEFFCAGEARLRVEDFAELGWTEAQIWGASN